MTDIKLNELCDECSAKATIVEITTQIRACCYRHLFMAKARMMIICEEAARQAEFNFDVDEPQQC